ncbi:hypothetical protein ABE021_06300 [Sporosarcina gallistercoris]|uniref:hypothetical protein n=1 Tax=Sporosarcina gallistercoris TaxID=2762245 RepID=UPI003D2BD475
MALVKTMKKVVRNTKLHSEVEATYSLLTSKGVNYIQINTYGSSDRKIKGIASQTIQLSEEVVNELQMIFKNELM